MNRRASMNFYDFDKGLLVGQSDLPQGTTTRRVYPLPMIDADGKEVNGVEIDGVPAGGIYFDEEGFFTDVAGNLLDGIVLLPHKWCWRHCREMTRCQNMWRRYYVMHGLQYALSN